MRYVGRLHRRLPEDHASGILIIPTSQNPNATSMPLVWEQLQKLGLSPDTIDILMASWRKSTGKQYTTYLSRWVTYCKNKQLDVTHATINDGLDVLTLLYKQGIDYSAINTARSALSSAITPADKTTFGEHPLVTRFLKGTFELRPSLPRYSTIWDACIVLTYLRSFPALNDLTLKQLTLNLTMLLALVTAHSPNWTPHVCRKPRPKLPSLYRTP